VNRNSIWETSSGSKVKIKDMNTQHILNSIKKIQREYVLNDKDWRREYLHILQEEVAVRNTKLFKLLE
jgi:hypothetical protein